MMTSQHNSRTDPFKKTNNGTPTTYVVNNLNQLTNNGGNYTAFTYDANGNRLTAGWAGYGTPLMEYTYDDENQLTRVITRNTSLQYVSKSEFVYDGLGRMRQRLEYAWDSYYQQWYSPVTSRYVYDGRRVIQERNNANTPTVAYTRGLDLSGTLEGAGGIGGLLARSHGYSSGNWSTNSFYHTDGNGNVTCLISTAQAVVASYRYDSYGNTLSSSGDLAAANVYRFSSKEFHGPSSLYYYGFRFYDPSNQRWPNRDPIGETGGLNLYEFTRNDAVNWIDVWGLLVEADNILRPSSAQKQWEVTKQRLQQERERLRKKLEQECEKQKSTCPEDKLAQLTRAKNEACDPVRSCEDDDSPEDILGKIAQANKCLRARRLRENTCFGGGNAGHRQQMQDLINLKDNCKRYLQRKTS